MVATQARRRRCRHSDKPFPSRPVSLALAHEASQAHPEAGDTAVLEFIRISEPRNGRLSTPFERGSTLRRHESAGTKTVSSDAFIMMLSSRRQSGDPPVASQFRNGETGKHAASLVHTHTFAGKPPGVFLAAGKSDVRGHPLHAARELSASSATTNPWPFPAPTGCLVAPSSSFSRVGCACREQT